MSFKIKQGTKHGNPVMGIAIGAGLALMFSIAFCAVITAMVNNGSTPIERVSTWICVAQGVCSFLGAMTAGIIAAGKRLQISLLAALVYFLCLLSMTALFFDGQYNGVASSALVITFGGIAAGLLGIRTKNRTKIKSLKRSYR